MKRFLPILLLFGATASAQTPAVNRVEPSAAPPGRRAEVELRGAGLSKDATFWTSFDAESIVATASSSGDELTLKLTVPQTTQVGVHALRVATGGGVSGLVPFMVDDLPTVREAGGNASASGAQAIDTPVAVDGACDALASDFYRFKVDAGQRRSFEVVAARLGSQLDPVLRLLDSTGRELKWADDSPGAGADCRFAHTFERAGEYTLELRDAGHEGGPAHRYRLRVGDFPLPVVTYPLGGRSGGAGLFQFLGEACDGVPPSLAVLPAEADRFVVAGRRAGGVGAGAGFAPVVVSDLDETVEAEPNDRTEQATPLAVPAAASGRFESAGDVDFYKLKMRKGERFSFRAASRTLGSACDVRLSLRRADGSKVAESKVEGPADAALDATAGDEGTYYLRVEELTSAGGPALAYRLEAEPHRPGFALSLETDTINTSPGGEFSLKVNCTRRDFGGAVTLSVRGLDPSPAIEGATIPAGKNETQLKVKLRKETPPGLRMVHVVGTATVDGREISETAGTGAALAKVFPRMLVPPVEFGGEVAVGVRGK